MSRNAFAQCERDYNEREEQRDIHRREVQEERASRAFAEKRKRIFQNELERVAAIVLEREFGSKK